MKTRVGEVKRKVSKITDFSPSDRLIMIVGNYGSGKTEVSVNLAIMLAERGLTVQVADLDIVNPYFRCREARELMEGYGIRVVVPPASHTWADLPIVVPEIKGMLAPPENQVSIFDVGGDDAGAKLLSCLVEPLGETPYALWQVLNARRPFTDTVKGCLAMRSAIEKASRLRVTGLVVNTHLMNETTPEVVLEGYRLARTVSQQSNLPIVFVSVEEDQADAPELKDLKVPMLRLTRHMLPPWLRPGKQGQKQKKEPAPAGRPVPIGRPQGAR